METEYTIEIDAPVAAVFDWFEDPEKVKRWVSNLLVHEVTCQTEDKTGAAVHQEYQGSGRIVGLDGRILIYEPSRRLAVNLAGRSFDVTADHHFHDLDGRTRLTQFGKLRLRGVMKIVAFFVQGAVKKAALDELDKNFRRLKRLCETEAQ